MLQAREGQDGLEAHLSLRARRERLGLSPLDLSRLAGCPVAVIVRTEAGVAIPLDRDTQERVAAAYGLCRNDFIRIALEKAEIEERIREVFRRKPRRPL